MAQRACSVCGRPAVTTIRRIVPGESPRAEHLCEVHAAQARGRRPAVGGGSLFDDFSTGSSTKSREAVRCVYLLPRRGRSR